MSVEMYYGLCTIEDLDEAEHEQLEAVLELLLEDD